MALNACETAEVVPGSVHVLYPDKRGILPLDDSFHVRKSLKKIIRQGRFDVTFDHSFEEVIAGCAEDRVNDEGTWINDFIREAYIRLHHSGFAHSVECWNAETGELAGGLYGVRSGGLFAGESMFSREPNASQVALVALVERLRAGGFALLDTQFMTDHLKQFGGQSIPQSDYKKRLAFALNQDAQWAPQDAHSAENGRDPPLPQG